MLGFIQVAGIKNLVLTPKKKILLPTEPPPKPSRVETFGTTTQGGIFIQLCPKSYWLYLLNNPRQHYPNPIPLPLSDLTV